VTELILVRHGQTAWNMGEIFRGHIDIDLDETGLKQVELLGQHLAGRKIEAVFSSPLQRAVKTARAIASRHGLDVQTTDALIDFNFGHWEGMTVPDVKQKFPEVFDEWSKNPHLVRVPGGDTLDDVTARSMALVRDVVEKYSSSVALVSHRVVSRILMLAMMGLDNSHFWNIRQDTASLTIFVYERGRFILTRHNDTSYLQSLHMPDVRVV